MSLQIANLDISGKSKAIGEGIVVEIASRVAGGHLGRFIVSFSGGFGFDPAVMDYPAGGVKVDIDLSDSIKGVAVTTSIEQINTYGTDNPTLVLTGRCKFELKEEVKEPPVGCSLWLLAANNKKREAKGTPDVISFVVFDRYDKRVAYGTGPVVKGDVEIAPLGD